MHGVFIFILLFAVIWSFNLSLKFKRIFSPSLLSFLRTDQSQVYPLILIRLIFCLPLLSRSSSGKSVVPEPKDEVQAAEVGGGGLGVAAEEERLASHKPLEAGDQTGEPGGN